MTDPDKWTASSMYQATRIFASNLNGKMAQRCSNHHKKYHITLCMCLTGKACLIRFYNLVLLPRIRDDIAEYKKLNPHLYMVSLLTACVRIGNALCYQLLL